MQTRPETHTELSDDELVQLAESAQEKTTEEPSLSTTSLGSTPGLPAPTFELSTAAIGTVDHVVVLDLTAVGATPGVAGLEGLLPSSSYQWLDRLMNIMLASVTLLLTAPIMILIAIAIKLTSRGPVFYTQPRIGLNRRGVRSNGARSSDPRGQLWAQFLATHDDHRTRDLGGNVFAIYKFRTMYENAEAQCGAVWATRQDSRTTSIGCFLRKYRLDELPQMINVLRGDMNIVGPRPERPSIFARMRESIDEYALRQRTKPGITGWAQINLFYDACIDDVKKKVRYDLEYLRNKSFVKDLKIMASTLPAVLFKRRGW
jgi:lipopolysaccharide/colanic/teichoic acid biosynthesis glycosyltransferase